MNSRQLVVPTPVAVRPGPDGIPANVAGAPVASILEQWLVEDRWWTARPLRRRYFEAVLENGRNVVVFHDLVRRGWFEQRA